MVQNTPTIETYTELQEAFDHFNKHLFNDQLPPCLITLQREKLTEGYFKLASFTDEDGNQIDEIAMNPSYFPIRSIRHTLSVLAHEQCHQYQFHHANPGRRGYHKEYTIKSPTVYVGNLNRCTFN